MSSKSTAASKKRKRVVDDSDDEEMIVIDSATKSATPAKGRSKEVSTPARSTHKKKRVEDSDGENDTPPNDKKSHKSSDEPKNGVDSTPKNFKSPGSSSSNRKSPGTAQKNNLLNYFKKMPSSSSLDQSLEKTPAKNSEKSSEEATPKDAKKVKEEPKSERKKSKDSESYVYEDIIVKKEKKDKDSSTPAKKKEVKEEKHSSHKKKDVKEEKHSSSSHKKESSKNKEVKEEKHSHSSHKKESSKKKEVNEEKRSPTKSSRKSAKEEIEDSPVKKSDSRRKRIIESDDEEFATTVVSHEKTPTKKSKPESKKDSRSSAKTSSRKPQSSQREATKKKISDLWVDKYKPTNFKSVIGMQGDRSPLNKLLKWLKNWHFNLDAKPGKPGANNDGVGLKAALLSGLPGIGKTTIAHMVCRELGYDFLELNASDCRSKRSIKEDVKELLANTKLTSFFQRGDCVAQDQPLTTRHCLVMDEVDGMAGNEDRGGVAELILLIKNTKVPIICICNDRGHPKMRSLVNYCFDIRVPKPKLEHVRGPLKSIAFKEKFDVSSQMLDELIVSSNFDIRQCIGNLAMLSAGNDAVKNMINKSEKAIKDVKLGPFDAIRKVFATGEEYSSMTFADKSDLFFADYSIMPLFVYENYCQINLGSKQPSVAKQLQTMAKSIDSLSRGDIVERSIRSNQNWSLLPLQAALSSVIPGSHMRSEAGLGYPQFPQYMGKISTTNKNNRLVDELVSHMTLSISGTRTSFALDYLEPLKNALAKPLQTKNADAVEDVIDVMESYSITRENMSSLFELSLWGSDDDPLKSVDTKVKRALTTAYNKRDFSLPYGVGDSEIKKIEKRGKGSKGGKGKASAFVSSKKAASSQDSDAEDVPDDDDEELVDEFF